MTSDKSLQALGHAYGVHADFHDLHGHHHPASPDTLRALLTALGADTSTKAAISHELDQHAARLTARIVAEEVVIPTGQSQTLRTQHPCDWIVLSEDEKQIAQGRGEKALVLPALDVGYYLLQTTFGKNRQTSRLLVRPLRAPDVTSKTGNERLWGMTGALYGLRGAQNGGLGNYNDLGTVCTSLGQAGAQFFGINPIHALGWAAGEMISPYSPTHRGFFNIDHIATATGLGPSPTGDLIDYAGFRSRHRSVLEAEYADFQKSKFNADFKKWIKAQPDDLHVFACYEALSETHGADIRRWPVEFQSPGKTATAHAAKRADFHAWLQWRAETQISEAQIKACNGGMSLGLYLDLAVGPRPGGAEVWMNQNTIARGVTIGAPPDHLSPEGQSWALAAHAPGPLAAAYYAPLRAMLRKLMARCGLLRIDHVLGLMRSFWLPDDGSPGGYISQPFDTFLAIIAIEAHNANCVIVGEDLGLVPEGFRHKLNEAGLYSYSVWQYEADHEGKIRPASDLSAQSLACFGTHDTPTLQGFWFGEDIDWWKTVGWLGGEQANARHGQRAKQRAGFRDLCGIAPTATATEISQAVQHSLAKGPSALLAIQLDDALGLIDAQNLPGTIDEHPNWRRRLAVPVNEFTNRTDIQNIRDMMPKGRNHTPANTKTA